MLLWLLLFKVVILVFLLAKTMFSINSFKSIGIKNFSWLGLKIILYCPRVGHFGIVLTVNVLMMVTLIGLVTIL